MSEVAISEGASVETEKPVQANDDVKFPPFPEPIDNDFDEDVTDEEKSFYKNRFPDFNSIVHLKLHCTACDRHLGCSARNDSRMRSHPMLRTLICHTCHSFYNSGEFDKGEDGSELYCRWCGQGGQVYCCSDCPIVFCAKCIKRNFGINKIKEIENTDDWKCFKCNPRCLWDLRAICWALLRYCDLRNKIVFQTEDPELKEKYQKACAIDTSECCKNKGRRKEKIDSAKKKEKDAESVAKKIISKMPATIQVKKFASINLDDTLKSEKKAQKRPASPKNKMGFIQKPISIAPCPMLSTPVLKKIRLPNAPLLNPVRFSAEKKMGNTYSRMPSRPRPGFPIPIVNQYNGFNSPNVFHNVSNMPNFVGDNINLSLETLTQGLDMAAVAAFNNAPTDNDVVCTPDFPLEPLCEVTEDNDDDVECITPAPVAVPKMTNPPPLVPRSLPDISNDNIVQMTENDVTVNALTGGLKFRVDPQTLSSNKMYRLPDGRIFAINPNPNMPGGYSATIVSVADSAGKVAPKGETYAAKLSAITPSPTPASQSKLSRNHSSNKHKRKSTHKSKSHKTKDTPRQCDLKVPVEWYRYNLIDAVDALDYSMSRLNKLKKETTTAHLRTRTVDEMKYLHRTLEQLLTTSSKRFIEIRENLNKEMKTYVARKTSTVINSGDISDDDVEILPDAGNDDPIFIDENSVDSVNGNENQEVDLTGALGSEHNDSGENKNDSDPLLFNEKASENSMDGNNVTINSNDSITEAQNETITGDILSESNELNGELTDKQDSEVINKTDSDNEYEKTQDESVEKTAKADESFSSDKESNVINGENEKENHDDDDKMEADSKEQTVSDDKADQDNDETQDTEMSEELIETLLKDDSAADGIDSVSNTNSLDIPEELQNKL